MDEGSCRLIPWIGTKGQNISATLKKNLCISFFFITFRCRDTTLSRRRWQPSKHSAERRWKHRPSLSAIRAVPLIGDDLLWSALSKRKSQATTRNGEYKRLLIIRQANIHRVHRMPKISKNREATQPTDYTVLLKAIEQMRSNDSSLGGEMRWESPFTRQHGQFTKGAIYVKG